MRLRQYCLLGCLAWQSDLIIGEARGLRATASQDSPAPRQCPAVIDIRITFLGTAGLLIQGCGRPLLTDPFFSNPSFDSVKPRLLRWFFRRPPAISSNTDLIDSVLPSPANDASMILVGHGHYDHLMDVPYVATQHARTATIYASRSVANVLFAEAALRDRTVSITGDSVGRFDHLGQWIWSSDGAFRVMALQADHSPTIRRFGLSYTFANGRVDQRSNALPRAAGDWRAGEPLSYLIDVLDANERTVFRIYFQDTANSAPLGFPPLSLDSGRVDLAILAIANAQNVRPASPDSLLRILRPTHVVGAHWESFFDPWTTTPKPSDKSNIDAFERSVKAQLGSGVKLQIPKPGTVLEFSSRRTSPEN